MNIGFLYKVEVQRSCYVHVTGKLDPLMIQLIVCTSMCAEGVERSGIIGA